MRWSIGKSKYGQVSEVMDTCWDEFASFLHDASHISREATDEFKDTWYWVAPFILLDASVGVHRTNDDVSHMASWLGGDLDHGNWQIDAIKLKLQGLTWLAYTTTQSTYLEQRWRLMVMMDREYTVQEHARLFTWFNNKFNAELDVRCRNVSRIFYLPAEWIGADNVWYAQEGTPCKVDSILAMIPAEPVTTPTVSTRTSSTAAPAGSSIITSHMLSAACGAPVGGRLMKLMGAAAKRYRINGWELSASDLAIDALGASGQFSPGKKRPNLLREAQRAIDWAERNFQPQSTMDKLRDRILWEQERKATNLRKYLEHQKNK